MQNSENPYVLNPYYFSNITTNRYDQSWSSHIFILNNYLSTLFGFLTSITVIYLVFKNTPISFKSYSRVILIFSFCDLYYVLADFLTQPRFKINGGAMLFTITGSLSSLNYEWQCRSLGLLSMAQAITYLMLPFQFYYRYSTIKNCPPTFFQNLVYIIGCVFIVIVNGFMYSNAFCTIENPRNFDYGSLWYQESHIPQLIIGDKSNTRLYIFIVCFGLLSVISYLRSIWLAWRTMVELKRTQLTPKTLALQKQFGRALFAQALVPLIVIVIPVSMAVLATIFNAEIENVGQFVIMSIFWHPFFSSFSTILFIAPYRNHCLKLFRKPTRLEISVIPRGTNSSKNNNYV